jgi:hypothetical protein
VQAVDGTISIVYNHRCMPDRAILMTVFTEEDAQAGEPVNDKGRLRVEVARLTQE